MTNAFGFLSSVKRLIKYWDDPVEKEIRHVANVGARVMRTNT